MRFKIIPVTDCKHMKIIFSTEPYDETDDRFIRNDQYFSKCFVNELV